MSVQTAVAKRGSKRFSAVMNGPDGLHNPLGYNPDRVAPLVKIYERQQGVTRIPRNANPYGVGVLLRCYRIVLEDRGPMYLAHTLVWIGGECWEEADQVKEYTDLHNWDGDAQALDFMAARFSDLVIALAD